MDLVWYGRFRREGGDQTFTEWEFSTHSESYEEAAAPAQVGKRMVGGPFDIELDPPPRDP